MHVCAVVMHAWHSHAAYPIVRISMCMNVHVFLMLFFLQVSDCDNTRNILDCFNGRRFPGWQLRVRLVMQCSCDVSHTPCL